MQEYDLQYLLIAKVTLVSEIPHGDLSNFDQILSKYVKKHQLHVGNFQGRHFLRNKKSTAPHRRKGLVI